MNRLVIIRFDELPDRVFIRVVGPDDVVIRDSCTDLKRIAFVTGIVNSAAVFEKVKEYERIFGEADEVPTKN